MSRIRNVKGKITEIIGGDYNMYSEENIVFTSALSITETGEENGVTYGEPQDPPLISGIKEIEIITALDDGSANDLSGGLQKGFIYGNTYEIKVKSYINHPPQNKDWIKWMIKYHDLSQNSWVEIRLTAKGDYITLTINNNELCGRFVYVRAYLRYPEREAELKVWMHNRFRWFDRMDFQNGLITRKNNPAKINQHATSLCGTAALLYFYAQDFPQDFYDNYMEFFRTGEITINNFKLNPNKTLYDVEPNQNNLKYPHYDTYSNGQPCIPHQLMHQTDWIILAGTRSSDNKKYQGQKGEDWNAINWPNYMVNASIDLYGASVSVDKTFIISGRNFSNKLLEIEKLYSQGWHIILLIDSDMLNNSISYIGCVTQYHWIAYEGNLKIDPIKDEYSFSYYCWQNLYLNINIRSFVFNTNFYGYIKFKK